MKVSKSATAPLAFVLMPFSSPIGDYYEPVFKAALEAEGYQVARADDLFTPTPILDDIRECIRKAEVLLCEMTNKNPNVFYELGLAHAIGKPAILLAQSIDEIPFDLKAVRTIVYNTSHADWAEILRSQIRRAVGQIREAKFAPWPAPLITADLRQLMSRLAGVHQVSAGASRAEAFRTMMAKAKKHVVIMGIGMTNMARLPRETFHKIAQRAKIDFIMIDPELIDPKASRFDSGYATKLSDFLDIPGFSTTARESFGLLKNLCLDWNAGTSRNKMSLRVYDTIPAMSMVMTDPNFKTAELEVEFYLYRAGEFRPRFTVKRDDEFPGIFDLVRRKFEQLWNVARVIV